MFLPDLRRWIAAAGVSKTARAMTLLTTWMTSRETVAGNLPGGTVVVRFTTNDVVVARRVVGHVFTWEHVGVRARKSFGRRASR